MILVESTAAVMVGQAGSTAVFFRGFAVEVRPQILANACMVMVCLCVNSGGRRGIGARGKMGRRGDSRSDGDSQAKSEYIETFKVPSSPRRLANSLHSSTLYLLPYSTLYVHNMPSLVSKQVGPTGFGLMSMSPVLFAIYQI